MSLSVHVLGREVATLEAEGDFKSAMTYHDGVAMDDFVSLTMHVRPAYDMITTAAYPDYASNPPGIAFMGRKTWDPGRTLQTFLTATFGLPAREQVDIVDQIAAAMTGVGPQVRAAMEEHPGFVEIGKRMLLSWQEGIAGLRHKRIYATGNTDLGEAFTNVSDPEPVQKERQMIGRSELLGKRQ